MDEARAALDRLPVAASYNLTMMDATGAVVTAFVSPGNDPEYADSAVATNHRGRVPERPEHARALRSVERQDHLLELLDEPTEPAALAAAFLQPPLYSRSTHRVSGPCSRRRTGHAAGSSPTLGPG